MKTPRKKHKIQRDRLSMLAASNSNFKNELWFTLLCCFSRKLWRHAGSIYSQSSRTQGMSQRAQAKVANTTAVTRHVLSLRAFSVLSGRQDVLLAPAIRFTFTLDTEVICRAYLFLCGDFILNNMVVWRQNHSGLLELLFFSRYSFYYWEIKCDRRWIKLWIKTDQCLFVSGFSLASC